MRPVVLDTSVILPAVLSSRGYRRRFLWKLAQAAPSTTIVAGLGDV